MRGKIVSTLLAVGITFVVGQQSRAQQASQEQFSTNAMDGAYENRSRSLYLSLKLINWKDALGDPRTNTVALAAKVLGNNGCMGIVSGFAIATKNNQLIFKHTGDEKCHLIVNFKANGSVRITEEDCSAFHGMNCSFSGELKRVAD